VHWSAIQKKQNDRRVAGGTQAEAKAYALSKAYETGRGVEKSGRARGRYRREANSAEAFMAQLFGLILIILALSLINKIIGLDNLFKIIGSLFLLGLGCSILYGLAFGALFLPALLLGIG